MAEIIWAETALEELNAICEYIQTVNDKAAKRLFQKAFETVSDLSTHPEIGSYPSEIQNKRYRQILCGPCRIFYRIENKVVLIVHVFRGERLISESLLENE